MELEQVKQDIERWIETFVEVPNPALGGWPPCPYARRARLDRSYEIRKGVDVYTDLMNLATTGLAGKEVVIYVYDPVQWPREQFARDLESANIGFLLPRDIIALEDHPADPEWVNGVCMNQGTYALALCQSVSDLDSKARSMATKGFYHTWPEEYLKDLFQHRKDPRQ